MNPLQELLVNTMSAEGLREVVRELIAEIERRNAIDAESMKKVERIQEVVQGLADQTEAVEACRPIVNALWPLLKYEGDGLATEVSITMSGGPVAVVRLDELRRAAKALAAMP